jgi:predicted dehydrogenase
MVDACRARGVILGIGHERRYEAALSQVKRMVDSGELGTLVHLECNWSHNRFATAAATSSWRWDPKEAPAGFLTATGIHIIDYFQYLAGPVARIYAQSAHRSPKFPGDDVIIVQYTFASGVTGVMTNIASTPFHCRINVFGDGGWAEACEISNMDVPDPATLTVRDANDKLVTREFPYGNTVRANLHEWADAVAGRAAYRFTDAEKLHAIQILEGVLRSLESGSPVAVEQP